MFRGSTMTGQMVVLKGGDAFQESHAVGSAQARTNFYVYDDLSVCVRGPLKTSYCGFGAGAAEGAGGRHASAGGGGPGGHRPSHRLASQPENIHHARRAAHPGAGETV
eukprot:1193605-Prorocentrum_minimum.AAC.2